MISLGFAKRMTVESYGDSLISVMAMIPPPPIPWTALAAINMSIEPTYLAPPQRPEPSMNMTRESIIVLRPTSGGRRARSRTVQGEIKSAILSLYTDDVERKRMGDGDLRPRILAMDPQNGRKAVDVNAYADPTQI
jgi:hypothetical protein